MSCQQDLCAAPGRRVSRAGDHQHDQSPGMLTLDDRMRSSGVLAYLAQGVAEIASLDWHGHDDAEVCRTGSGFQLLRS